MKTKNLIIITSDEMRGDCQGFSGNPDCATPHLDAFANRGIVFQNHFCVHGKCVPSRVSIMTGRYPHTDGYRTIFQHIPENEPNLLTTLKEAGFESAVFGHNHVWENFFGTNEKSSGVVDYHSYTNGIFIEMLDEKIKVPGPAPGFQQIEMPEGYDYEGLIDQDIIGFSDYHRTAQAMHYLEKVRDSSKPFYMQLNLGFPHPKYQVEEPYFSMYNRQTLSAWPNTLPRNAPTYLSDMRTVRTGETPTAEHLREIQAVYYGMITRTDMLIGKLLAQIESLGLLEDTMIIFTSDHGDFAGQYGLVEKWDTCMQDCIMHVPMILFSPDLPVQSVVDSLTEHTDLAPTILELLGLKPSWGIHGTSLVNCVCGTQEKQYIFADGGHEEEMLSRISDDFTQQEQENGKQRTYFNHPEAMARVKMVRSKEWKLEVRIEGENELYHLTTDPHEMKNVYDCAENARIIQDLQLQLIRWCLRTDTDRPYQGKVRA